MRRWPLLPILYPSPGGVGLEVEVRKMIDRYKRDVLLRLKTVRGHLDAVIAMVEREEYCPELAIKP